VLTNRDLEKMVETSDEWIVQRTGISERRILEEGKPIYSMGAKAAEEALKDSGIKADQIGLIIVTSTTPDYLTPTGSSMIQKEIGAGNAAAFDMVAACTGFIYGIVTAQQFIQTGYYDYVLVVSQEGMSRVVDFTDRNTCVLFGDAAGAVVLGKVEDGYGILSSYIASDGTYGTNITIPDLYYPEEDVVRREKYQYKRAVWQDGSEVFKFAVKAMPQAAEKVIADAGLNVGDIDYLIPHQANIRIIDGAVKRLGMTSDRIYTTIEKFGNVSSASIPLAITDAYKKGKLKKGDNLVFVGFGGGLTWGAALVKWSK